MPGISYLCYGINIAAYPQHHDSHHYMCSASNLSGATTPCLTPLALVAACFATVEAGAQWHSMPQFSACCAGLRPSEPKQMPGQA